MGSEGPDLFHRIWKRKLKEEDLVDTEDQWKYHGPALLCYAANLGNLKICKMIISKKPSLVNQQEYNSRNFPIHSAASNEKVDVVKFFMKIDPD